MFGNLIRIDTGPDGSHQLFVHTDSLAVAIVLVALLLVTIVLASVVCYYLTRALMLWVVGRLARGEHRKWVRAAERRRVFHKLAPIVPALIIYLAAPLLASLTFPAIAMLATPMAVAAACFMVYAGLRAGLRSWPASRTATTTCRLPASGRSRASCRWPRSCCT